jgi:hypothetical protein
VTALLQKPEPSPYPVEIEDGDATAGVAPEISPPKLISPVAMTDDTFASVHPDLAGRCTVIPRDFFLCPSSEHVHEAGIQKSHQFIAAAAG